uniref:Uncharacterized protein n=1 Tax=Molossus molossus TaxID=27622 RepID=A0A7J8GQT4_MOLMO|nr:hypothetical protein HJG59_011225 [Molossus molossus]
MPCLCPPQTLCTPSSQGLDVNKEIHHPGTESSLEGTIHRHPAFTNGCQGQRHPGLAAPFLAEGRKNKMDGAGFTRCLKNKTLTFIGTLIFLIMTIQGSNKDVRQWINPEIYTNQVPSGFIRTQDK